MEQVCLDTESREVQRFIESLNVNDEGVELVLRGRTICEVVAPNTLSASAREALIARGRELAARARERNAGVPADVLAREICDAVDEVRSRAQVR